MVPMTFGGISFNKLSAFAVMYIPSVDDYWIFDVVEFDCSYELNSIPVCNVLLSAGREATSLLPANIHYALDSIRTNIPIFIYVTGTEFYKLSRSEESRRLWPDSAITPKIFEGRVVSISFEEVYTKSVLISVVAKNWLCDLDFSSVLSDRATVTTPNIYYNRAFVPIPADMSGGLQAPAWTSELVPFRFINPEVIASDVWGSSLGNLGVLGYLRYLALQDLFLINDFNFTQAAPINTGRLPYLALNRFEPVVPGPTGQPGYYFGVNLPLFIAGGNLMSAVDVLSANMATAFSRETIYSHVSQSEGEPGPTFWSKLINVYCSNLQTAIVPMVDRALFVPYIPGFRYPYKKIYTSECVAVSFTAELPRPIAGVSLLTSSVYNWSGGFSSNPGGDITSQANPRAIGGMFVSPDPVEVATGQFIFTYGPSWTTLGTGLNEIAAMDQRTAAIVFGSTAINPGQDVGTFGAVRLASTYVTFRESILNGLARAAYIYNKLRLRNGYIICPFRLDIAPGSTIQIDLPHERFTRIDESNPEYQPPPGINPFDPTISTIFAEVRGVRLKLNSEDKTAATILLLSNIRSASENRNSGTSIDYHPIWATFWNGAPLHPWFDLV